MSVSGITSGIASINNPYHVSWQNELKQRLADFKALQESLANGDLKGAKKAFDSLQSSAQLGGKDPKGELFGPMDQLNDDFKAVGDALASGNLADAKKAFAKLQEDMQKTREAHDAKKGNHHHGAMTVTVTESVTITETEGVVAANSNDNDRDAADQNNENSGGSGVLNITA